MDSPEGQQSIEVRDVLWNWLEDVQIDAKQRKLIWPDAERLDLEQSIQRVQKKYPDFPRNEVEEFLLDWIDMGYDPENYSQAQLDELDSLTERWVADHLRKAKASKNERELGTLELLSQATLLMPSCHAATSSLNHAILRGAIS
jgi:glycerol-3-phosphate cytidylyltransferase-like family protein